MTYETKNFEHLLGVAGFSDNLLKNHFGLYGGYVANANKLNDILTALLKENEAAVPEYSEIKRRFGWEFNGMRLHELYFGNIAKGGADFDKNSDFFKALEAGFGSYEEWEKDFRAVGAMRGIGWVVLYFDPLASRLFNVWINEHDAGHLVGAIPLLVMDVFEHAYMLDYGIKKIDYIEAFFQAIDWRAVIKRFNIK